MACNSIPKASLRKTAMPCWAISSASRATSQKHRYEGRSMKVTSASVDFPAALAIVREGGSLDADASARVFETIMSGAVPEADLTAFLTAQATRGPTVPEIVGAVRAMRAGMRPVSAPEGAIDLCGTGGDGHGTLNISTAVSFVVAGAGVP